MSFWITVLTFAAVSLLVGGIATLVYDIFFRYRSELTQRLSETFDEERSDSHKASPLFRDLRKMASHTAARANWRDQFHMHLQQSGVPVTGWQLLASSLVVPILTAGLGLLNVLSIWILFPIGVVGAFAPWFFVSWQRRIRLQKLCSQLPRAFDMMSRAVRAGQTVPAAMQIVAEDLESPISEEFGYCYEQQNLGIPAEITFRDLAKRCGVMELQIFVVALLVQNRTGGNLTEMLDNLAAIVRKRMALKDRVKALTGEGRMQAGVLTVLPIAALIALIVLAPEYANTLLERPWLLGTAGGAQLLGIVWIRSIINFDA